MNERIRELYTQALENKFDYGGGEGVKPGEYYSNYKTVLNAERFAELIVRECLDIASEVRGEPATDTHFVIGYDRACEKMIDGIKEHFGVEE